MKVDSKMIILIIVIFIILRQFVSSPYASGPKPPVGLIVGTIAPLTNQDPSIQRYYTSFLKYINQLRHTSINYSYYTDDQWNRFYPNYLSFKIYVQEFINTHNYYATNNNAVNLRGKCNYFIAGASAVSLSIIRGIAEIANATSDPGFDALRKGELTTHEFYNAIYALWNLSPTC